MASCLLAAGCYTANAQLVIDWQQCDTGDLDLEAKDLVEIDNCQSFFVISTYEKYDPAFPPDYASDDIQLRKLDKYGQLIWYKMYGGSHEDAANRLLYNQKGEFFVIGSSYSSDGDISNDLYPSSTDMWIIKTDTSARIIWNKILGGSCKDYPMDAALTFDGGLVAIGATCSDDGDISHAYGGWDMWAVKLDSSGNKCWDFSLGSSAFEYGNGIIATADSGFLLLGDGMFTNDGNIDCLPEAESYKGLLAKIDKNGIMQWHRCYGGTNNTSFLKAIETENGYILGGTTACDDGDMTGSGYHLGLISGHPTKDIWLSNIDHEGNVIWQKCYGGSQGEYLSVLKKDGQNNLLVTGISSSFDGDVKGNHSISIYDYDIWIIKVDINTGQLLWQQCFGGNGQEEITHGIVQKNDSTWVLAGTALGPATGNLTCSPPDMDDFTKDYIWTFEVTDTNLYVSSTQPTPVSISVQPNPVKDWLTVDYSLSANFEQAVLNLTDLSGRILYTHHLNKNYGQHLINLSQFAPGAYFVTIQAGFTLKTVKFVKIN